MKSGNNKLRVTALARGESVAVQRLGEEARVGHDPGAYARAAYRLRFVLGPTVGSGTIARVRSSLAEEAQSLLDGGVSPKLLGLQE